MGPGVIKRVKIPGLKVGVDQPQVPIGKGQYCIGIGRVVGNTV